MNNICPECGGTLILLDYGQQTKNIGGRPAFYGCKYCHRIFWGSDKDSIPPKERQVVVPDN